MPCLLDIAHRTSPCVQNIQPKTKLDCPSDQFLSVYATVDSLSMRFIAGTSPCNETLRLAASCGQPEWHHAREWTWWYSKITGRWRVNARAYVDTGARGKSMISKWGNETLACWWSVRWSSTYEWFFFHSSWTEIIFAPLVDFFFNILIFILYFNCNAHLIIFKCKMRNTNPKHYYYYHQSKNLNYVPYTLLLW